MMQIVIDIDEEILQGIIEGQGDGPGNIVRSFQATIADAIKNGTPLPKYHGRLIDADELRKKWIFGEPEKKEIDATPTIIEADKEAEYGKLC